MKKDTVNLIKNLYESEEPINRQQSIFDGKVFYQGEDEAKSIEDALTYDTFEFNCYYCGKEYKIDMKKYIDFLRSEGYTDEEIVDINKEVGGLDDVYPPIGPCCADPGAWPKGIFKK